MDIDAKLAVWNEVRHTGDRIPEVALRDLRSSFVEFLNETGSELTIDLIKEDPSFDPLEATQVLQTTFLRRIFLKAAVALVKADGVYSDAERHALGDIADAFGISNAEFGDLEQEATGVDLQA